MFHTANFYQNLSSLKYRFLFPIWALNHSVLLKDRFLKNAFKNSENALAFLRKSKGSNNSFTLIEKKITILRKQSLNTTKHGTLCTMVKIHLAITLNSSSNNALRLCTWFPIPNILVLQFPCSHFKSVLNTQFQRIFPPAASSYLCPNVCMTRLVMHWGWGDDTHQPAITIHL